MDYAIVIQSDMKLFVVKKDPDGNKILECAVSSNSDYIVTGDKHLLDIKEYKGIKIVTAKQFLELVRDVA